MLAVIRLLLLALGIVLVSIVVILRSLLRPFHPNNVYWGAQLLARLAVLIGIKMEIRGAEKIRHLLPGVFICNHQNSYDIFTVSRAVLPGTVSIGKKSLKWIPFFGQMYWLTGNILIDRKNSNKAMNTIALAAKKIRELKISVWLFPEGTRSNGRGLLPFKTGAFRTAVQAQVPIFPVCVSNLCGSVKLNRWNNGKVIIEFLPAINVNNVSKDQIRKLADETHDLMATKIVELSKEAGTAASLGEIKLSNGAKINEQAN